MLLRSESVAHSSIREKFVDGYSDPEGAFKRLMEGLNELKK
jgi:hypothetical protein